eukprot:CAMPEP_0185781392 /NCGR_PEP_ID=MMETSP1174-20130828/102253_1 /TAXON_ID=35687 /ORGANISM="Dictyocha speculum, Strain CCMP1381" /LENGTH=58 /DNA_ID=CAMNT_0028471357 /DNA_START=99 /DNA_END=272 /DNA_ORIENTATION=+
MNNPPKQMGRWIQGSESFIQDRFGTALTVECGIISSITRRTTIIRTFVTTTTTTTNAS